MNPVDAWLLAKKAEQMYWGATASTFGAGVARYVYTRNPATLRLAGQMASFGVRAHANAIRGVVSTPLARGSPVTLGGATVRAAGAVGTGYVLGALYGEAISYFAFGREGQLKARELYRSPTDFWEKAILGAGKNVRDTGAHYM